MVTIGMAFADYLITATANREGVRLSSRGRFEDLDVVERVVAAGGLTTSEEPRLYLDGPHANFGVIISHFPIGPDGHFETDDDGNPLISTYVDGVISAGDGQIRPIQAEDSRIQRDYEGFHGDITVKINELRQARDYEAQRSEIVVIETFYAHEPFMPLFLHILQMPDPLPLYFASTMRVTRDSRVD
jgi:hypothetical protein